MKILQKYAPIIFILILNLICMSLMGQPGGPPGGDGGGEPVGGGSGVPLDGGAIALLLTGAAILYKKHIKKEKVE